MQIVTEKENFCYDSCYRCALCATGGYVVNVLETTFDIAFNFVILSMLT